MDSDDNIVSIDDFIFGMSSREILDDPQHPLGIKNNFIRKSLFVYRKQPYFPSLFQIHTHNFTISTDNEIAGVIKFKNRDSFKNQGFQFQEKVAPFSFQSPSGMSYPTDLKAWAWFEKKKKEVVNEEKIPQKDKKQI